MSVTERITTVEELAQKYTNGSIDVLCNHAKLFGILKENETLETHMWKVRESLRLNIGFYVKLPKQFETMWVWQKEHYLHKSLTKPECVAYTPNPSYGERDRQVVTTLGRYLTQFHPELGAELIKNIATLYRVLTSPPKLKIAKTIEEIKMVYRRSVTQSCMTKSFSNLPEHPVAAYAGGDLEVAYLEVNKRITARAVIWPEKKTYVRIYGDIALQEALHAAGYVQASSFEGAKLRRISYNSHVILPYIDGNTAYFRPTADKQFFTIVSYSTVYARNAAGYITTNDDEDEERVLCLSCEYSGIPSELSYSGYHNGYICGDCLEEEYHYAYITADTREYVAIEMCIFIKPIDSYVLYSALHAVLNEYDLVQRDYMLYEGYAFSFKYDTTTTKAGQVILISDAVTFDSVVYYSKECPKFGKFRYPPNTTEPNVDEKGEICAYNEGISETDYKANNIAADKSKFEDGHTYQQTVSSEPITVDTLV